jgi:hypothetical protein
MEPAHHDFVGDHRRSPLPDVGNQVLNAPAQNGNLKVALKGIDKHSSNCYTRRNYQALMEEG